jgi:ribosomal protein S18 acetylase RimI-like enzyme
MIRNLRTLARMVPGALGALGARTIVALRMLHQVQQLHPSTPEHHYLSVLAIDPSRQGQGLGSELLAPVLARCDRDRVPAYLESSNERNRPFYRRHGFEVVGVYRVPNGGPSVARMWRDPRSSTAV